MKKKFLNTVFIVLSLSLINACNIGDHQESNALELKESSAPWVFWYWMNAAVSKEGIQADLKAMKEAGIAGAYLMPISGPQDPPAIHPPATQLSAQWWKMVRYAMHEADSLGLKLGMNVSDGFATAGGPWITPALSMQKVVWSEIQIEGGKKYNGTLPQPETNEGYYKDIATYAFPSLEGSGISTFTQKPKVTTSNGKPAAFLLEKENEHHFVSHEPCWIQYKFDKPFTCRSVKVRVKGPTVQAYRLLIKVSDDGTHFRSLGRLKPARSGWQDYAVPGATFSLPTVKARYFRFVFDPKGSEPGSEDLDGAKWKPTFKLVGLSLFSKPQINQFEGKNGSVWRISDRTTREEIPSSLSVPKSKLINITKYVDATGKLNWQVPEGEWTILRMGHTSTGMKNATGGGAKGLECDKFNPKAVTLQFNHWFGKVFEKVGDSLASRILKMFHVDSWECGSQNWSPVFRKAFKKYCGYDPIPYLPAMAGIPIQNAKASERFLYDVRYTIAHLIKDNFFKTLRDLAHKKGCLFSAESVAPTMVSNDLLQDGIVDIPMGEFWFRSPTHDKPNDILDAISGAHIYGKNLVSAEGFTELRAEWDEHPGMLKSLLDRNYALGINRIVYHVFTENPWLDRKPGMTLNGVGLYFQRDQTWWKPGRAWVAYAKRCQRLLQKGHPVVDIAAFTGWEIPRRALLPDRLLPMIPGVFGSKTVEREKERLENVGQPLKEEPVGVTASANIFKPENWINPLRGYHYDSFNEDALLNLAKVKEGKIELPGGINYRLLIIPGKRRMMPEGGIMKLSVGKRLVQLVKSGASILMLDQPTKVPGLKNADNRDEKVKQIGQTLLGGNFDTVKTPSGKYEIKKLGKGKIIKGPYYPSSFKNLGIDKDLIAQNQNGAYAPRVAWTHRRTEKEDIYFISNQVDSTRIIQLSLRVAGKIPELYDPVTDEKWEADSWNMQGDRTHLSVKLPANGSLFVLLKDPTTVKRKEKGENWKDFEVYYSIKGEWKVHFHSRYNNFDSTLMWQKLKNWANSEVGQIKYYSGAATYSQVFKLKDIEAYKDKEVVLNLGQVNNIASVKVNGVDCGVAWTFPYQVNINKAVKKGINKVEISVYNTWANRLIGDHKLPEDKRVTHTNAEFRLKDKELLPSGLLGPVKILISKK